jgi:hypothetical protein
MRAIATFIIAMCSISSVGQTYSLTIDSLTKKYLDKLSEKTKAKFDSILVHRTSIDWLSRLDKLSFDYAFIDETFCYYDTASVISESYFMKNDTIPKSVIRNNESLNPKEIFDGFLIWYSKNVIHQYTLYPLIDKYSKFKQTQKLSYDKRQIWSHGCVVQMDGKKNFEKK